jgi:hypothetical protein
MFSSISQKSRNAGQREAAWYTGQLRPLAIAMALIVNIVILAIARIATGDYPVAKVGDDVQTIGLMPVIWVTLLAGLVAWGLLVLLERTTARAATIWLGSATVFFLLSLFGPLGQGDNTSSKVVLALMHIGAFITIVPAMWRSATSRRA